MKDILSILGLFVPRFFEVTLSSKQDSDKRCIKYFLPYAYMKRRMKYVFLTDLGNENKDHGLRGILRGLCPYGTVLWWDRRYRVSTTSTTGKSDGVLTCKNDVEPGGVQKLCTEVETLRREVADTLERLELLVLRALADKRKNRGE